MLLGIIMVAGMQLSVFSQDKSRSVVKRQVNQSIRIRQGIVAGELTRVESRRLILEQRQVKVMKVVAKADGVVTRKERAVIITKQNQASRHIYRQKHDGQSRR